MNNKHDIFKLAKVTVIIQAIILIPSTILGIYISLLRQSSSVPQDLMTTLIIFSAVGTALALVTVLAIRKIGEKEKINKLTQAVTITFILSTLMGISGLLKEGLHIANILLLVATGIFITIAGVNLRKVKKLKKEAKAVGILYIISGIFMYSIILVLIQPIVSFITCIFEFKLFSKASKAYK